MSDGGKTESGIINYSVNRGSKYNQMGIERTALMENESRISNSSKSGNEKKISLPLNCFSSSNRNLFLKQKFTKHFPYTIHH